jgi:hypothetical protein
MATVLAPMITSAPEGETPVPAQRFACTHVANPAYVVETQTKQYIYQYGATVAQAFIDRIQVVRGNVPPAGERYHHTGRGYF